MCLYNIKKIVVQFQSHLLQFVAFVHTTQPGILKSHKMQCLLSGSVV